MAIKKYHVSTNLVSLSTLLNAPRGIIKTIGQSSYTADHLITLNLKPNTNYTLSTDYEKTGTKMNIVYFNYADAEYAVNIDNPVTLNSGASGTLIIGMFEGREGSSDFDNQTVYLMLNEGSTPLPYEPYGDSFKDWFYREYGTETETFTTLPHEVIGDGQSNLTWSMDGNMQVNGTPTPQNPITPAEVGEKTANLCSGVFVQGQIGADTGVVNSSSMRVYQFYDVTAGETYSFSSNVYIRTVYGYSGTTPVRNIRNYYNTQPQTDTFTVPSDVNRIGICLMNSGGTAIVPTDVSQAMLNKGQPMDYEPFGYKIPISFNQTTYNIYITEPLRKSLDGSNVYDELSSNGTLTRRVDENGDALATPTTEQVTVPTLTTTGTPEQFNVLTTLAPSEVSLTYHGWHEHEDTKFTT